MKQLATAKYLCECFDYDPETGVLTWKARPRSHFKTNRAHAVWNSRYATQKAGTNNNGYIGLILNKSHFPVHRVIWAMHTGEWPKEIDHKNGDRGDNRLANLRAASRQQNGWNTPPRQWRDLPRGVGKANQKSGFVAGVTIDGRRVHLGTYDTPEEAHAAWRAAVEAERGEFFHPG